MFGGTIAKVILALEKVKEAYNKSQVDRIHTLRAEGCSIEVDWMKQKCSIKMLELY